MDIIVKQKVKVNYLKVKVKVRYPEDAKVCGIDDVFGTLIPCREFDSWCPFIDIDKGTILNWEKGVNAKIHYKVCDEGSYYLLDEKKNIVSSIINDYVPVIMCPGGPSYGDYIIMNIDENGKIENWKCDISDFVMVDEEEEE